MLSNSGLLLSSHHTQPGCSPTRLSIRQTVNASTVVRIPATPVNHEVDAIGPTHLPRSHQFLHVVHAVPLPPPYSGNLPDQHPPVHLSVPGRGFAGNPAFVKFLPKKRTAGRRLSHLSYPTLPHYRLADFTVIKNLCG